MYQSLFHTGYCILIKPMNPLQPGSHVGPTLQNVLQNQVMVGPLVQSESGSFTNEKPDVENSGIFSVTFAIQGKMLLHWFVTLWGPPGERDANLAGGSCCCLEQQPLSRKGDWSKE